MWIMHNTEPGKKMLVFDLDHFLLKENFIEACARTFNFRQALALVRQIDTDTVSLTRRIAAFLRDRTKIELMDIANQLQLVPGTIGLIQELKQRAYIVGIISDSYNFVAQIVANNIGADFELSNELVFQSGKATGEVLVPSYFHYCNESTCKHQVCNTNALRHICRQYKTRIEECIIVGEDESNTCMMSHATRGNKSQLLKYAV